MLEFLKKLLGAERREPVAEPKSVLRRTGAIPAAQKPAHVPRRRSADTAAAAPAAGGPVDYRIDSNGPGKNVLVPGKHRREESGTQGTLEIMDYSLADGGEEPGIDPYNTGSFDRSRNWDKRFRD